MVSKKFFKKLKKVPVFFFYSYQFMLPNDCEKFTSILEILYATKELKLWFQKKWKENWKKHWQCFFIQISLDVLKTERN